MEMGDGYFDRAVAAGRLRVVGYGIDEAAPTDPDRPLRDGQAVRHTLHRHEPPVRGGPVPVLAVTPDVVAVGKVASIPVHTAGQYHHNTIVAIVEHERPELGRLFPVHRLDRPVSGVTLLARSREAAHALCGQFEEREVRKTYLARVAGRLPEDEVEVDQPLAYDVLLKRSRVVVDGAEAPAGKGGHEPGASRAKAARTAFRHLKMCADGATSIVECRPWTGRTHQIRAHLAHCGTPIANDATYGGVGPEETPRAALEKRLEGVPGFPGKAFCPHCPDWAPKYSKLSDTEALWLHATRYALGGGAVFRCPPPAWAEMDEGEVRGLEEAAAALAFS